MTSAFKDDAPLAIDEQIAEPIMARESESSREAEAEVEAAR